MRQRFHEFVDAHPDFTGEDDKDFTEFFAYMSLWYASLWVALDGWGQQGIQNNDVEAVLADKRFDKLKDYRDATMHYRPGYFDKKLMGFTSEPGAVEWVNVAHRVLGDAILAGLNSIEQ